MRDFQRRFGFRYTAPSMLLLGLALSLPDPLASQATEHAFGVGWQFQSYSFDEGLGAKVATLNMVPLAYSVPIGGRLGLDFYGAYADGRVERGGTTYLLQGMVDTRVRAIFQASPWAILTASVNLPTGNATHDEEEAVVASVLSTDVLGFREATWGTGGAVTTGFATAMEAGTWSLGLGASYRLSQGFEPTYGSSLTYEPGNEIRVRLGLDRNVGEGGKFTTGVTYQNFSEDQFETSAGDMRNLFQAGSRIRGDMSYAFRSGRSTWALYGVDIWREKGDAFLDLVDSQGTVVGDTTVVVGSQNLVVVGLNGSALLGSLRVRPALDFRYQMREEDIGEGWLAGAGLDIPLRLFGSFDAFPRGRFSWGQLKASDGETRSLWGVEVGLMLRWQI